MVKPCARVATSLTGPVEPLGGERDHRGARRHRALRAKRAADKAGDDAHLLRLDAEPRRHAVLQPIDELARLIDGETIVGPHAGGGEQFDRIVMLGRRAVFGVDHDLGAGNGACGVAGLRQVLVLVRFLRRIAFLEALRAETGGRRLFVISRLDALRPPRWRPRTYPPRPPR